MEGPNSCSWNITFIYLICQVCYAVMSPAGTIASSWLAFITGVPSWIIYICVCNFFVNDFCWLFIELLLANYADDNRLCVIRQLDVKYALEAETEKAIKWFDEHHMRANPIKFQCIVHTKTHTLNFNISLGDIDITLSDIVNLLGLIIRWETALQPTC